MSWFNPDDDATIDADDAGDGDVVASPVVAAPPAPVALGAGAPAYPLAPYASPVTPTAPATWSFRGAMKDEAGRRLVGALFGVVGTVVPGLLVVGALYVGYRLVRARVVAARAARAAAGHDAPQLEAGRGRSGVEGVGGTRRGRRSPAAATGTRTKTTRARGARSERG